MGAFIQALADAMTRQEGFKPGTRAYRNNNPGNIWDGLTAGKTKRIWPGLPIDERGYVIYPTLEAGRAALERDLSIKVARGMTLESLITMYAPPVENDTAAYIRNVSAWLGIPTNQDLRLVAAGWGSGASGEIVAGSKLPEAEPPGFPSGRAPAPTPGRPSPRRK